MYLNMNIRGTNGSGKTSIGQRMVDEHPQHEKIKGEFGNHNYSRKAICHDFGGAALVGRYKTGVDGIIPQTQIETLIETFAPLGHIIWENVLISGNFPRWFEHAQSLGDTHEPVWLLLDTPADTCIQRIKDRRARAIAAGSKYRVHQQKGFREDLVRYQHWRSWKTTAEGGQAGLRALLLDHTKAYEQVHDMWVRHGWECPAGHGLLLPDDPGPLPLDYERVLSEGKDGDYSYTAQEASVSDNYQDVVDFHNRFELQVAAVPQYLSEEDAFLRVDMMLEELLEFSRASRRANRCSTLQEAEEATAEAADALVDLVYFALGTAVHMGLPWQAIWDEVHRANMEKEPGDKQLKSKRGAGRGFDVLKPDGWTPPDIITAILNAPPHLFPRKEARTETGRFTGHGPSNTEEVER